jgi:hypothetical protein
VDPGDELQAPIAGVEAHDAGMQVIQPDRPLLERTGKGSVMDVRRGEEEQEGQSRPATEQGMDAVAAQERAGVMVRSMAHGGHPDRLGATPGSGRCQ